MSERREKLAMKSLIRQNKDLPEILRITGPAFVELVMTALFGMVDMIMLGQTADSAIAIAAVGLTNNPINLFLGLFAAVNIGTTTAVAWQFGADRPDRARDIARHSLLLNLVIGIIGSAVAFAFSRPIVGFMGAEAATYEPAVKYLQIITLGLLPQALNVSVTASMRGVGLTRLPMLYNLFSNGLNVIGNYILIYGKLGFPAMGVTGAAISTTISRVFGCLLALFVLYFVESPIKLRFAERFRPNLANIGRILKVGSPAALEQLIMQSGFLLFARTVSGLGTATFAAHQIGLSISSLSFSPSTAFGVAGTTLVGQALGARRPEEAMRKAEGVHKLSLATAIFVGVVFLLFSKQLALLYTNDLTVAAMAATVLKIMAFVQPGQSTQLSLAGVLRGAGDTRYPLYASAAGIWIFRVLGAYIVVRHLGGGLNGAWLTILFDQYTRAIIVYLRYRSRRWLRQDIAVW